MFSWSLLLYIVACGCRVSSTLEIYWLFPFSCVCVTYIFIYQSTKWRIDFSRYFNWPKVSIFLKLMEKENNSENNNTVEAWELNPKKDGCCLNCTCKWYVEPNGLLLISLQKIFCKIYRKFEFRIHKIGITLSLYFQQPTWIKHINFLLLRIVYKLEEKLWFNYWFW